MPLNPSQASTPSPHENLALPRTPSPSALSRSRRPGSRDPTSPGYQCRQGRRRDFTLEGVDEVENPKVAGAFIEGFFDTAPGTSAQRSPPGYFVTVGRRLALVWGGPHRDLLVLLPQEDARTPSSPRMGRASPTISPPLPSTPTQESLDGGGFYCANIEIHLTNGTNYVIL